MTSDDHMREDHRAMQATQYRAVCDGWTDAQAMGPFGPDGLDGLRQHVALLDALGKRNARVERRVVTADGATDWEVVEDHDTARAARLDEV